MAVKHEFKQGLKLNYKTTFLLFALFTIYSLLIAVLIIYIVREHGIESKRKEMLFQVGQFEVILEGLSTRSKTFLDTFLKETGLKKDLVELSKNSSFFAYSKEQKGKTLRSFRRLAMLESQYEFLRAFVYFAEKENTTRLELFLLSPHQIFDLEPEPLVQVIGNQASLHFLKNVGSLPKTSFSVPLPQLNLMNQENFGNRIEKMMQEGFEEKELTDILFKAGFIQSQELSKVKLSVDPFQRGYYSENQLEDQAIILRTEHVLKDMIYNPETEEDEISPIAVLVMEKKIDHSFLRELKDKWGTDFAFFKGDMFLFSSLEIKPSHDKITRDPKGLITIEKEDMLTVLSIRDYLRQGTIDARSMDQPSANAVYPAVITNMDFINSIIRNIVQTIALIIPILFIVMFLISQVFIKLVILRPIEHLSLGVNDILQRGNLSLQIPIISRDEIGFLTHSFNSMVKKLFLARKGLEESLNALEQSNKRLALLVDSTRNITTSHDKFGIMEKSVNSILSVLTCQASAQTVFVFKESDIEHLSGYAHFRMPVQMKEQNKPQLKLDSIQEIHHFFSDTVISSKDVLSEITHSMGCSLSEDILSIPICHKEQLFGFIEIQGIDKNFFTEEDKHYIDTLVQSIAISLEDIQFNSQLRHAKDKLEEINQNLEKLIEQRTQELQDSVHQLHSINNIVKIINQEADFDIVMDKILETFSLLIPSVQRAFCMIYNPARQSFQLTKTFHLSQTDFQTGEVGDDWIGEFYTNVKHYIGWAAITLQKGIQQWNLYRESAMPKTVLTIPITIDEEMVGLFHFDNQDAEKAFNPNMLKMIGDLNEHITSAFIRARNLRDLEMSYQELKTTKIQLAETERIAAMTQTFEKFVPKQFLTRIAAEGIENIELGKADSEVITILFSDIRNFTTLSETLTPQELLNFLNAYLKRMNEPIHTNFGFIDKFIGDAIMAIYDIPGKTDAEEAQYAVKSAIDMQKALKVYNSHRSRYHYAPIETGIGIHTGPVVIGTVGSIDRMDSTVLGDTVNLASRLEGLTKYYQCSIIISSQTYRLLKEDQSLLVRELDFVSVKGKEKPITIFEVFNSDPEDILVLKQQILDPYHQARMCFYNQEWKAAIQLFQECLAVFPNDPVSRIYLERCTFYQSHPPQTDWDGIFQQIHK